MGVPLAALSIGQNQPNTLDQFAKIAQIKNLVGQNQLQQIQIQDAQAGQKAMQQWDGKDLNGYVDLLRKNGASANSVLGVQQHILAMHAQASQAIKNDADAAKTLFDTENEKNQHLAAIVGDVLKRPPEEQAQALEEGKQTAIKNQWLDPQHAQTITYHSPEQLLGVQKMLMGQTAFTADQAKQADAEKSKQDAALAAMKVKQQSGLQSGAMDSQIDQIFPPAGKTTSGANQRYKSQANFFLQRGDLEGAKGVLSQASAEAGKTEEALNPDIQANKIALSTAEGAARANVENAAARGGNPALANVPKGLITPATAAAEKAGNEYNDALAAARDMKTFIDDARAGNKVAYAYAPVEGVLTLNTSRGVKRVNMPEIHSYAGSGSLADKVEGWLGKNISGASLPPDILNDMEKLHMGISSNAQKTYTGKLKNTNKTYGSAFEPVEPEADSTTKKGDPLGIR